MAPLGSGHALAGEFAFEIRPMRFWCDLRNSLASEVFFLGSFEPHETLLLPALLRTSDTCVDVGAALGMLLTHRGGVAGSIGARARRGGRLPRRRDARADLDLNPELKVEAMQVAAARNPLLKPVNEGTLDSWPHVLASREPQPFA
jgi:hypothetical protein